MTSKAPGKLLSGLHYSVWAAYSRQSCEFLCSWLPSLLPSSMVLTCWHTMLSFLTFFTSQNATCRWSSWNLLVGCQSREHVDPAGGCTCQDPPAPSSNGTHKAHLFVSALWAVGGKSWEICGSTEWINEPAMQWETLIWAGGNRERGAI